MGNADLTQPQRGLFQQQKHTKGFHHLETCENMH